MSTIIVLVLFTLAAMVGNDWPNDSDLHSFHSSQRHILSGGLLGYEIYGNPDNDTVILMMDSPFSRVLDIPELYKDNFVVIPERPGYGISQYQETFTLQLYAKSIKKLMTHLKVNSATIVGIGAGGPYALALSNKYPSLVKSIILIAPLGPVNEIDNPYVGIESQFFLSTTKFTSNKARGLFAWLGRQMLYYYPYQDFEDVVIDTISHHDRNTIVDNMHIFKALLASITEGLRPGCMGYYSDMELWFKPWGFQLQNVPSPVSIWYSKNDTKIPSSHIDIMCGHLQNVVCNPVEGHGNLALILDRLNQLPQLLKELK
eukprot:TRINITY_DN1235_c0_g1_i1.p1 TRINITY_DN1235_c0_g1~~TRINITY_DN1235_c0_g1_i1.p1  ORF type:complete len:316 (+),score=45.18 TRINITY_DN1235_c0_g1_i1:69-1016(+)